MCSIKMHKGCRVFYHRKSNNSRKQELKNVIIKNTTKINSFKSKIISYRRSSLFKVCNKKIRIKLIKYINYKMHLKK